MFYQRIQAVFLAVCLCLTAVTNAGPYTGAGVNGYIGDDHRHANPFDDDDAVINPIFRGWATGFVNYLPSDDEWTGDWDNPNKALGPVTGDNFDIVSLGDMDADEIATGWRPGEITLLFGDPNRPDDPDHIRNLNGYDFVVFENGFISGYNTGGGSVSGQMLAEFGYVEVSSDGNNFVRFNCVSLTQDQPGPYGIVEISNILNLAGKHPNAFGICTGTAFDLSEIADDPNVVSGIVDINNICYIRIVDVPGSGDWTDEAVAHIDPNTRPDWDYYPDNHPIYDAWITWGSGGLDLEAVGVLEEQAYSADINLDGIVDSYDLYLFATAWLSRFGENNWIARCDLAKPGDLFINFSDFAVLAAQWLEAEQWYSQ